MKVTIVIPCRREEHFIGRCLDSVLENDYPRSLLEVLVIDGMSDDGTRRIIDQYHRKHEFVKLIDNPSKTAPSALNIGIALGTGELIMRMDAHSIYPVDYISKCVEYIKTSDADNVGGLWVIRAGGSSLVARTIPLATSHPFGAGNAYYRIGTGKPRYVDTVPFGCYKRSVFSKIGLFDEDLVRNQDDEFNLRLIKNGGKILLAPDIKCYYYARDTVAKLWKMNFQYGYFKPLVAKKLGAVLTVRQVVPALFVASLGCSLLLMPLSGLALWLFLCIGLSYLAANAWFSLSIARRTSWIYLLTLPLVFLAIHFSYGTGYLKGILDFILFAGGNNKISADAPITR